MTPAARLQSVIDFFQGFENSSFPADRAVRDYFRTRRFSGSKDRAAITERIYAILRRRAHLSWRMGTNDPRALVLASLIDDEMSVEAIAMLFDGTGYGPAPLTDVERAALSSGPAQTMTSAPAWVEGEYPEFLHGELTAAFGADLPAVMAAMGERAHVDIRVNTLAGSRAALQDELTEAGFVLAETPYSPMGLRLDAGVGAARLSATKAFIDGRFELQDEAAQIASLLCGVGPGMRVLDFAAGAGGKTLALAALMENQGEIVAYDIAPARLHQLESRAARAGVKNVRTATTLPEGAFDAVFLDSPCTGTGTWRRQPEQRWRLTPERLTELTTIQSALLDQAAATVKPGGRLVYATCSVLACENVQQIEGFLSRHPEFRVVDAAEVWRGLHEPAASEKGISGRDGAPAVVGRARAGDEHSEPAASEKKSVVGRARAGGEHSEPAASEKTLPPGMDRFFLAAPHTTGTDGFFAAVLQAA